MSAPRTELPEPAPIRERAARPALPERDPASSLEETGMTHVQLVAALRAVEGLEDVGSRDAPNFQFRSRPFLHFHEHEQGTYADVRFGSGDFEPVWAATPRERAELLAQVCEHVESLERVKKARRGRLQRGRRR